MQVETQGHVERAPDAVDANFAVALCSVAVTLTEGHAAIDHREVVPRAGRQLAHVQIAAERPWRARTKGAVFCPNDAHDSKERRTGTTAGTSMSIVHRAANERDRARQNDSSKSPGPQSRWTNPIQHGAWRRHPPLKRRRARCAAWVEANGPTQSGLVQRKAGARL